MPSTIFVTGTDRLLPYFMPLLSNICAHLKNNGNSSFHPPLVIINWLHKSKNILERAAKHISNEKKEKSKIIFKM